MRPTNSSQDIQSLTISLLSPEEILTQSYGEVTEAETINYRTLKPEKHGLFCEQTFGPVKDWECHCGKYRRIRYKGIVCDRCGVEVTEKKVRRQRMGHIELAEPVAHIWYFKKNPNKISALLDIPPKKIEQIVYFSRRVIIQPGIEQNYRSLELITEEQYDQILYNLPPENQQLPDNHPDKFIAQTGARALETLLKKINLHELADTLKAKIKKTNSQLKRKNILKRLQIVEAFRNAYKNSPNKPEWMILRILAVIPPDLRPLIFLEGGRFATADLNNLYRKVIIRNKRLKKLLEIKAPDVICRNEKRMLQEAVDALIDNSRQATPTGQRPLKSLTNVLESKQGRFRQDLLGKRVDYSGRSVIVVGPTLKLHECGLPKEMAAELFKPFIIRRLLERGIALTVKTARQLIHQKQPIIWEILENVLKGRLVLLNRAPTLHRLGIQAYQPKLVEGRAIQLPPLSCTAFNADFDGDQMAVHVPLSQEALLEGQILMLSSHNLLNPSNGSPIVLPTQDIILGLYYLTKERKNSPQHPIKGHEKAYTSIQEVLVAFNNKKLSLHAPIQLQLNNQLIRTTTGRVIFNQYVPKTMGYINELITTKTIHRIVVDIYCQTNTKTTAKFLDKIKNLGFQYAYQSGITLALDDIQIPTQKENLVTEAQEKIDRITTNYHTGLITDKERYNQVIDVWTRVTTHITQLLGQQLQTDQQGFNTIHMMMHSGARGSMQQTRQLAGLKGLIGKVQKILRGDTGDIIENAIITNFKEGMSSLEYFTSTHGARKGLTDTALKTADAGYLTRRLVDVAQNLTITTPDCRTLRGTKITPRYKEEEIVETLAERILGRTALHDIHHPQTNQLILAAGQEIDEEAVAKITQARLDTVYVRSIFTCDQPYGFCAKCYGRNLATGRSVNVGEAVGVIAAQSIGEPGTQLTMRTFHLGGDTSAKAVDHIIHAKATGLLQFENLKTVSTTHPATGEKLQIVTGRAAEMQIVDPNTNIIHSHTHIPYSVHLKVKQGQKVQKGDPIYEWDPYNALILSDIAGQVTFDTIEKNLTYKEVYNKQTGHTEKVIIPSKDRTKHPKIHITHNNDTHTYNLPVGAYLLVKDQATVHPGQTLAKIPRVTNRASDITGGLPRVTALFEARVPSKPTTITTINGIISYGEIKRNKQEIIVTNKNGIQHKHLVPLSKHILVQKGDYVHVGTPLCEGKVAITDILSIHGLQYTQSYIVDKIKEVYRLQGVKINDKHIEIIVHQMLQKVVITDPGDTHLITDQVIHRQAFYRANQQIVDQKIVLTAGGHASLKPNDRISPEQLKVENEALQAQNLPIITTRDAQPALATPKIQGITKAAINAESFLSAASFQETAKVLSLAAISSKKDTLQGLKENVILSNKIPAGTGLPRYRSISIKSQQEQDEFMASQQSFAARNASTTISASNF